MIGWIVSVIGLGVMLALVWWSGKAPDDSPGDELARKFRESGGPLGM